MATSGSFSTSAYNGRYLTVEWQRTSYNASNNTSEISWAIKGAGQAPVGYYVSGAFKLIFNGAVVWSSSTRIRLYNGTLVASGSNSVSGLDFSAALEAGIYIYAVNVSGNGSWKLDGSTPIAPSDEISAEELPRYTTTYYTVVWGDSLTKIVKGYTKNGYSYVSKDRIKELNPDINVTEQMVVGTKIQVLAKLGQAMGTTPPVPSINTRITSFGLFTGPIINGVNQADGRTLYVTWTCKRTNIEKFEISWGSLLADGKTWDWEKSDVDAEEPSGWHATYSFPDDALAVKFGIRAISKTKDDEGHKYWPNEGWIYTSEYQAKNLPLEKPATPEQELTSNWLGLKLAYTAAKNVTVEFEVYQDDSTVYKRTRATTANTGSVTVGFIVDSGHSYKSRARVCTNESNWSEWSDFQEEGTYTVPAKISRFKDCRAVSERGIFYAYCEWEFVKSAYDTRDVTFQIQYTNNIKSFDTSSEVQSLDIPKDTLMWRFVVDAGYTYYVRIRAINDSGESAWSEISSITIGDKPAVPTTWSSVTSGIIGEDIKLFWVHNASDNSHQTKARISFQINEGAETRLNLTQKASGTITIPGTEESIDWEYDDNDKETNPGTSKIFKMDTSNLIHGITFKWKVQTWGVDLAKPSDDSVYRTVKIYEKPNIELNVEEESSGTLYPITTVTHFPFYITTESRTSDQLPIGYGLTITANKAYETVDAIGNRKMISVGETVFSDFVDLSIRLMWEMKPEYIDLQSGIDYTVTCTVAMDSGLSATATKIFNVSWTDSEYNPNAYIEYDPDTLQTQICAFCEDQDGNLIPDVTLAVYRREYDGSFKEIGKRITNDRATYVVDPHPPLDYARYRVVVTNDNTGAVSFTDIRPYAIGEGSIVIQWAEQWSNYYNVVTDQSVQPKWTGSMVKLPYNIDVQDSASIEAEKIKYVGRSRPVTYYGTMVDETPNWSTAIPKTDAETIYALRRLAVWPGDVYVREPSGTGYWANVKVSFSMKHNDLTIPVNIELTRVEGGL